MRLWQVPTRAAISTLTRLTTRAQLLRPYSTERPRPRPHLRPYHPADAAVPKHPPPKHPRPATAKQAHKENHAKRANPRSLRPPKLRVRNNTPAGIARFVKSVRVNSSYFVRKVDSAIPSLQHAYALAQFGVREHRHNGTILIFDKNSREQQQPQQPQLQQHTPKQPPRPVRRGKTNPNPMKATVQIITSPTADTDGTVVCLTFDSKKYLIGQVGEGTQRANTQIGNRFTKTQNLFLTGPTRWKSIGGIMGLVLTVSDMLSGQKKHLVDTAIEKAKRKNQRLSYEQAVANLGTERYTLDLHGAQNLMHAIATCRRFIFRKGVPLNVRECRDRHINTDGAGEAIPTWSDDLVKVWALVSLPTIAPAGRSPSTSPPAEARKRSIDEADEEARFDDVRKAVVSQMFGSDWSLDSLHECSLREVSGPAKIFVRDPILNQLTEYKGPVPWKVSDLSAVPDIRVFIRRPWPAALVEYLPPTSQSDESVSYIFKTHPRRGKFLPNRAKELKVEMGTKFSLLTKGESVKNADGETITPDMVMEPTIPGSGIAVLDIPSAEYVRGVLDREEWTRDDISGALEIVVWILGPGLQDHPDIQQFIKARPETQHVFATPEAPDRISMDSSYTSTQRLRSLAPSHFAELQIAKAPADPNAASVLRADRDLDIVLMPKVATERRGITYRVPDNVLEDVPVECAELVAAAQKAIAEDPAVTSWANIAGADAEIVCLGTGSSIPSMLRNVSATLIRVPGAGSYLLDCGENTLGQLRRVYGDQLGEVLRDLRMIWISHLHADHHLGTTGLLKAWYQEVYGSVPNKTALDIFSLQQSFRSGAAAGSGPAPWGLTVLSEPAMLRWLAEYSQCEDIGYSRIVPVFKLKRPGTDDNLADYHIYTHGTPAAQGPKRPSSPAGGALSPHVVPIPPSLISPLFRAEVDTCFVPHCHGAQAIAITWPSGFKVAYSGDTRPSSEFVRIGLDATVCIHEATFEKGMESEARAKRHSTTDEALGIARRMRARAVLLTHFSQRYPKLPEIPGLIGTGESGNRNRGGAEAAAGAGEHVPDVPDDGCESDSAELESEPAGNDDGAAAAKLEVAIAFDFAKMRVADIPALKHYYPAIQKLLETEVAEPVEQDDADGEEPAAPAQKKDKQGKQDKPAKQKRTQPQKQARTGAGSPKQE